MRSLNQYLYGTHKARYYLIGADSGVGKTTLTDFMYVYHLWKSCKEQGKKLDMIYYSWEISLVMKKAKWAALLYYLKYKELIHPQYILGQLDGMTVTDAELTRLITVNAEIEEMFQSITFLEEGEQPTGIWKRIVARAEKYGEVVRDFSKKDTATNVVGFNPHPGDENVLRVTVIDHLALIDTGKDALKQAMDACSAMLVKARNLFSDTAVVIQQFNSDLQNAHRSTKKEEISYKPSRQDFGDSKYTFRDADVVLGFIRPVDYELEKWGSYKDLRHWGKNFVVLYVMKNRYGPMGSAVPLFVDYMAGIPYELPTGEGWTPALQERVKADAAKLAKIHGYYTPKDESGGDS